MQKEAGKPYYITTTLPYVNADPHIGFALEIVHADVLARYKKAAGFDVFFNTGTDEHGLKIFRKAQEENKETQSYVDGHAKKFQNLAVLLNLDQSILHFIRTTDPKHKQAAIQFWNKCMAAGDIYKKKYKIKYCVGCELEKTDSELVNSVCPLHPNLKLEIYDEENYFFSFSKYASNLLDLYKKRPDFVTPDFRFNEIKAFVERGLEDFSISRLKNKMPWGVAVPNDREHVMYVWFDALVSYISTLGWPQDEAAFEKWWLDTGGVIQLAGKDQVRQQAAMWQAMLMSAGLEPSKQIVIHGFITSGGVKMSKSLGNVIDPQVIISNYGTDALRYYLCSHIHPFEDSDFTMEKFKEIYNADLANGLGNLTQRILKMSETYCSAATTPHQTTKIVGISKEVRDALDSYNVQQAIGFVWEKIKELDQYIQQSQPFKLIKTDVSAAKKIITDLVSRLYSITFDVAPFLPETALKIQEAIKNNKTPAQPLFPRKD